MTTAETVKFNVGGSHHEVSRSLLNQHPNTMLARKAERSKTGPIFIDGNGVRFGYVLDYLRDGKVSLPLAVSKQAILDDLTYYGVETVDESCIGVGKHSALGVTELRKVASKMNLLYSERLIEAKILLTVQVCLEKFIECGDANGKCSFRLSESDEDQRDQFKAVEAIRRNQQRIKTCNDHLAGVGLELISISASGSGICAAAVVVRVNVLKKL